MNMESSIRQRLWSMGGSIFRRVCGIEIGVWSLNLLGILLGPLQSIRNRTTERVKTVFRTLFGLSVDTDSPDETTPLLPKDGPLKTPATKLRFGVPLRPLTIPRTILDKVVDKPLEPTDHCYSVKFCCTICRKNFPGPLAIKHDSCRPGGEWNSWEYALLAICPLPTSTVNVKLVAANLDYERWLHEAAPFYPIGDDVTLSSSGQLHMNSNGAGYVGQKSSYADNSRCQEAFAVHRTCWKLAKMYTKHEHIHRLIYEYGKATTDILWQRAAENTWLPGIRQLNPLLASLHQEVEPANLLYLISKLPGELETLVTESCANNLLATVIAFFRSTQSLLQSLNLKQSLVASLLSFESISLQLTASWITIYDETYLQDLTIQEALDLPSEKTLYVFPIRGVQIDVGVNCSEVKALRLLYADGSESPWLGDEPLGKVQTILGMHVTGLLIERDALKISKIRLAARRSWYIHQTSGEGRQYLLERPPTRLPFGGWRQRKQRDLTKRNLNTYQSMRILTLRVRNELNSYTGITVYCVNASVSGIVVHHNSATKIIGCRGWNTCAIYFPIGINEHLTSIWTAGPSKTGGGVERCPSILLVTSKGRTQLCAPVWTEASTFLKPVWKPLSEDLSSPISMIFSDDTPKVGRPVLNIGIRKESHNPARYPNLPQITTSSLETVPFQKEWPSGMFFSFATLDNVKNVRVTKRGNRYLGMFVSYLDEKPPSVLGQYDRTNANELSYIYKERKNGTLESLIFHFKPHLGDGWRHCTNTKAKSFVCDIKVKSARNNSASTDLSTAASEDVFCWERKDFSHPLLWYFNSYIDSLERGTLSSLVTSNVALPSKEQAETKQLFLNPGLTFLEPEHDEDDDEDSDSDSDL